MNNQMIFRKVLAPEEAQRLNASKAHRDTHEVYFATADGIKFALEAVGEKKFKSNVKDMRRSLQRQKNICENF